MEALITEIFAETQRYLEVVPTGNTQGDSKLSYLHGHYTYLADVLISHLEPKKNARA